MGTRSLTLSFSDVVGSTSLATSAVDPDGLRRRYSSVLRAAVHRHGGTEVKHLGDGLMAAFPSAGAAIDASATMHRCTAVLAGHLGVDLAVRVGLAHGDVTEEDGDLFGEPVVVAARLCAEAAAGETLASDVVAAVAGRRHDPTTEAVGELALKGLAEAVPAVRFDTPAHDPDSLVPSPLRVQRARDLVGRRPLVDQLRAAVLDALAGRGGAVLLEGDGGLGKTRLAAEAAAAMVELGGVAAYGAVETGLADPYAGFASVLAELGRTDAGVAAAVDRSSHLLAPLMPGRAAPAAGVDRRATFDAVAAAVAAVRAPTVVVVDDLHHAGPEAFALFSHVAVALEAAPVLLLGLARPSAEALLPDGATRIRLDPLGRAEVAELAARRGVGTFVVGGVLAATSGHPLLVDEAIRALAAGEATVTASAGGIELHGVPPSIEALVRRVLTDLGPAARDVALLLAVAGADASRPLLEAALGDPVAVSDGLAALAAADLVVDRGLGVHRIRHDLLRRAVLDAAGPEVLARTHLVVADALARLGASTRAQVWHRLAAADRHDVAAVASQVLRAARDERQHLAVPVAEALASAVLARLDQLGADVPAVAAEAHAELASVASWRADAPAARQHAAAAATEARRCGDADVLAEAAIQYTGWVDAGTDDPVAEQLFAEAHDVLDRTQPARQARLLAAEADYWSISRSRPDRGRPLAEEARRRADGCGDPLAVVDSLWALANAGLGDAVVDERLDIVRRLLAASGAEPTAHVLAHRLGVHAHLEAGDVAARDRSAATLRSLAERAGEGSARLWADVADIEALLRTGDLDAADAAIHRFAAGGDDPTRRNLVVAQLFKLFRERGSLADLLPSLDAAVADAPSLGGFQAARLLALHAAGRHDAARTGLAALLRDGTDAVPADQSRGAVLLGLAELASDLAAVEVAEVLLDALAGREGTIAVAAQGVFSLGAYDRGIGRLHLLLDRPGDAREHLRRALEMETAVGDEPSRRRTLAALADAGDASTAMIQIHEPPAAAGAPT